LNVSHGSLGVWPRHAAGTIKNLAVCKPDIVAADSGRPKVGCEKAPFQRCHRVNLDPGTILGFIVPDVPAIRALREAGVVFNFYPGFSRTQLAFGLRPLECYARPGSKIQTAMYRGLRTPPEPRCESLPVRFQCVLGFGMMARSNRDAILSCIIARRKRP
jgi:hypothetical protein